MNNSKNFPKQFEVFWVNLDPTLGHEMKKTRPCVVISPNEMNKYLSTLIISPITSKTHDYPTRVKLNYEDVEGYLVLDQIRTIDNSRLATKIGQLGTIDIVRIKQILKQMLVD